MSETTSEHTGVMEKIGQDIKDLNLGVGAHVTENVANKIAGIITQIEAMVEQAKNPPAETHTEEPPPEQHSSF